MRNVGYILVAAFCYNSFSCNDTNNPIDATPNAIDHHAPSSSTKQQNSSSQKNVGLVIITTIDGIKHVLVHMRYDDKLAGPGGAIDLKSGGVWESPEEAGAREAKEESGLDIPQEELKYLGTEEIGGKQVVMLLWETNMDTVPGPDATHNGEVKEAPPADYDAKDAGGKHMWIDLAALRKNKGKFLSLFFQYAEQELVK